MLAINTKKFTDRKGICKVWLSYLLIPTFDGVGCAILAKLAFGEDVDIEYCNYDDINDKVKDFWANYCRDRNIREKYEHVFITDISITEELAEKINISSLFEHITLLDHHPTALGLNKFYWCKVAVSNSLEMKTSGTELFYQYLFLNYRFDDDIDSNKSLEKFVSIVRDYDTWRWSILGEDGVICKQVNDLLYIYGRDYFIEWCLNKIYDETFPKLNDEDYFVLHIKQQEIDKYIEEKDKTMFTGALCGRTCGFVFADRYFSELGNKLCTMHPEIDFVAMIDIDDCTVSYRTIKDDIDLGKDVAAKFGGGGHPKAAGSEFSVDVQFKTIEKIFA